MDDKIAGASVPPMKMQSNMRRFWKTKLYRKMNDDKIAAVLYLTFNL